MDSLFHQLPATEFVIFVRRQISNGVSGTACQTSTTTGQNISAWPVILTVQLITRMDGMAALELKTALYATTTNARPAMAFIPGTHALSVSLLHQEIQMEPATVATPPESTTVLITIHVLHVTQDVLHAQVLAISNVPHVRHIPISNQVLPSVIFSVLQHGQQTGIMIPALVEQLLLFRLILRKLRKDGLQIGQLRTRPVTVLHSNRIRKF